jgi:hypothetical protein
MRKLAPELLILPYDNTIKNKREMISVKTNLAGIFASQVVEFGKDQGPI